MGITHTPFTHFIQKKISQSLSSLQGVDNHEIVIGFFSNFIFKCIDQQYFLFLLYYAELREERHCYTVNSLLLDTFLIPLINVLLLGHINFLSDASGSWRRSWVTFDTRSCLLTVYSDNTESQGIAKIDTTRATFLYDLENDGHDDGLFKIWWVSILKLQVTQDQSD